MERKVREPFSSLDIEGSDFHGGPCLTVENFRHLMLTPVDMTLPNTFCMNNLVVWYQRHQEYPLIQRRGSNLSGIKYQTALSSHLERVFNDAKTSRVKTISTVVLDQRPPNL